MRDWQNTEIFRLIVKQQGSRDPTTSLLVYFGWDSYYTTMKKYELKKMDNELGGILLKLVDTEKYYKNFGTRVEQWSERFDLTNWKFFTTHDGTEMVGGCVLATKTDKCFMLEGRNDFAVLWEIRVAEAYKR